MRGERAELWRTPDERRRYDDFATLYALARALERLERAYVSSAVSAQAYERACVDLTSKFKTLRGVLGEAVPDLERFFETYGARVPSATRRLRAGVPATALHVATGMSADERVAEAVALAAEAGISILEVPRNDLDRITGGALHQGLALQVPPYEYAHPDDLLEAPADSGRPALAVALDGVTDPRNLGAIVRSVGAFGGHGVVVPQRRAAGMTAVAWRTSAGTAARVPVARATNLTRTLREYASAGLMVAGLAADGDVSLDELDLATGPLVVVTGSEGKGLSRLVRETCDVTVSIPLAGDVESLNASVATGVVLAEVARRRRLG